MDLRLILYAVVVAALVAAEFRQIRPAQVIFKTLAALGFCYIALWSGALFSLYGQMILAALAFCAVGDICLLSREKPALFQMGMAAFALGHLVYVAAFAASGLNEDYAAIGLLIMTPVSILMYRALRHHMAADMKVPVAAYHVIITLMIAAATGTQNWALIVPALMFAISDMFVGRDRFVKRSPFNPLMITPLYFGAQALFALSV